MEHLIDDYSRLASELTVHKKAAANIREQLLIIARSDDGRRNRSFDQLCSSLTSAIQRLQPISQLIPLQSYLSQGEISDFLDSLHNSCWSYTQTSNDDFLREDIASQREMYKSDCEADRVNMRRLLRDSLRGGGVQLQLSKLTPHETLALRDAVSLELKSLSDQGFDSQAARLYKEFLDHWNTELISNPKARALHDLTGKITKISAHPAAWGAICAVWSGELYGKLVSLQGLMIHHQDYADSDVLKNAMVWASFDHPHVVPLLGFTRDLEGRDGRQLALVAPWMKHRSIEEFLAWNSGADRLKLITEIAAGLAYLHGQSPPYVHGFLSGSSVLVNEDRQAVIGGFASAVFERGLTGSLRWSAPELIGERPYSMTTAADIYSFAMTALQIMTGNIPFDDVRGTKIIIQMIERGERPKRPDRKLIHHGLDDRLWSLISRCWTQDPSARPRMQEVLKELAKLRELPALDVRDLTGLIRLSSDAVTNVRACGAFGDIRTGVLEDVGPVALKTLNVRGVTQPVVRHTKRFLREASIWNKLNHPNVLPFLGTADPPGLSTCLVSPWMENGNLITFMEVHWDKPMLHIIRGIARGLTYLHTHKPHPVIHGDLRAANVLISDTGEPLLCDFGLAVIIEDLVQMPISSILQDVGNPRWMAVELFTGDQQVSAASDVWALGMVILEIISHDVPYREFKKNSAQVIVEVHKGRIPSRPMDEDAVRRGLTDELWDLMKGCWAREPVSRPSAAGALSVLESLASDLKE